jgi:hypothetical protein
MTPRNRRLSKHLTHARLCTVVSTAVVTAVILVATISSQVARADSWTWDHDANCNNWHPHVWSNFSWSGGPSNANGDATVWLSQWDYSKNKYVLNRETLVDPLDNGSSGSANADAYDPNNENGTGNWQAVEYFEYEYGDTIENNGYTWHYPNCGS